jgi:hypothetical protein
LKICCRKYKKRVGLKGEDMMKNFGYKEVGLKWAKKTPEVPRLTLTDKIYSKDRV